MFLISNNYSGTRTPGASGSKTAPSSSAKTDRAFKPRMTPEPRQQRVGQNDNLPRVR